MATATLWGRYKYNFEMPKDPTIHNLAWAISMAVHKSENKRRIIGYPRTYNYVVEALRENAGVLNFMRFNGDVDKEKEIYKTANELQDESKFKKVPCSCKAGCDECNGHGYVYQRLGWRVGTTFNHAIAIDMDDTSEENMKAVREYYQNVLGMGFRVFKTSGGYWLIGDKLIEDKYEFRYYHCKILDPELQPVYLDKFYNQLLALDEGKDENWSPATPEKIKASGLYKVPDHLNIDIAFTFLSIKRGQSTLRQSEKFRGDKIIEVHI